jgi:hypothetical protein
MPGLSGDFGLNGVNIMRFWQQILSSVVLAGVFVTAQAADITVTDWSYTFTDDITNAGVYYGSTLNSPSNASTISVQNLGGSLTYWKVQAKRSNSNNNGLNIHITRTGAGSGDGTISGNSIILLNESFKTIFCGSGTGDRTDIPLQFQLTNLGVEDGYGTPLRLPIDYKIITSTTEDCT